MDIRGFDDLQSRTLNTPLKTGGTTIHMHRLKFTENVSVKVVPSLFCLCLATIFIVVGGFFLVCLWYKIADLPKIFSVFFPVVFFGLAYVFLFSNRCKIDLIERVIIQKGKRVDLGMARALQVVRKVFTHKNRQFECWELNLVLADASRLNIYVSGNKMKLDEEVRQLSEMLLLPVWHAGELDENDPEIKEQRLKAAKKTRCSLLIIGSAFNIISLIILFYFVIQPINLTRKCKTWDKVPAVVTHSALLSRKSHGKHGKTTMLYKVDISAQYQVNGRTYICNNYDYFHSRRFSNSEWDEKDEIVKNHPVGKEITCLVNPKSPMESVITDEIPLMSVVIPAIFCMPFLALGLMMLISQAKKRYE